MERSQWPFGLGVPSPDRLLTANEFELLRSSQLLTGNRRMPGSNQLWEAMAGLPSVLATAEKIVDAKGASSVKVGANQGAGHNADGATECNIIRINRSKPFNPAAFIGKGWTIEEQDKRSLTLSEIDLRLVRLETTLESVQTYIRGEEKLLRLKAMKVIRLDAKVAQTLYEDQSRIPKEWERYFIYFDGTILRDQDGDYCVLYMYWNDGKWDLDYNWLEHDRDANDPSAVLAAT